VPARASGDGAAQGKTPVAVLAQRNESGGLSLAHMQVVDSVRGLCLGEAAAGSVVKGSVIMTEGWGLP